MPRQEKQRLDDLLVERRMLPDLKSARGWIMRGFVLVDGVPITRSGSKVPVGCPITLKVTPKQYASRGGYKLEHALRTFHVSVGGLVVLDTGASTGGFTDCLLQHGAAHVFAVDVGFGQLLGRLATDPRVTPLERTNIGDVEPEKVRGKIDFCTVDLSYLSLTKAIPIVRELVGAPVPLICLIKPLYEGLDEAQRADVDACSEVLIGLLLRLRELDVEVAQLTVSPILGSRGTLEFLMHVAPARVPEASDEELIARAIEDARRIVGAGT